MLLVSIARIHAGHRMAAPEWRLPLGIDTRRQVRDSPERLPASMRLEPGADLLLVRVGELVKVATQLFQTPDAIAGGADSPVGRVLDVDVEVASLLLPRFGVGAEVGQVGGADRVEDRSPIVRNVSRSSPSVTLARAFHMRAVHS